MINLIIVIINSIKELNVEIQNLKNENTKLKEALNLS